LAGDARIVLLKLPCNLGATPVTSTSRRLERRRSTPSIGGKKTKTSAASGKVDKRKLLPAVVV
jgi:hypothetical protein